MLQLCLELGIVNNREKSNLVPSQRIVYLCISRHCVFQVFSCPAESRESFCQSEMYFFPPSLSQCHLGEFFSGVLSSLTPLVPGGCLWMRSLQLLLHRSWDQVDDSSLVRWDGFCHRDLNWWLDPTPLGEGVSLLQVSPNLDFWSYNSDLGWDAHLAEEVVSGLWSPEEVSLSINTRELLAMERGLLHFQALLSGSTVAVFMDNTAVTYLRKAGGTRPSALNAIAQRILLLAEDLHTVLAPQFIMGKNNVLADPLSRPNQIQGSEWTLKMEAFLDFCKNWPVMVDLFASSSNHHCSLYFLPFHDPGTLGTDAFLQCWDGLQVYAFPPWSLIPLVLKKLRSSSGVLMTLITPYWPQRPWFLDLLGLIVDGSVVLPLCSDLLRQPHFHCRHLGIHRLSLHAWQLSSDLPGLRDSLLV